MFTDAADSRAHAETLVAESISEQFRNTLDAQFPLMSKEGKKEMVAERLHQLRTSEKYQFDRAVHAALERVTSGAYTGWSRLYLMGSDSYYYYYLTKSIIDEGNISTEFRDGQYFNPLRPSPDALWADINWHPYLGFLWYRVCSYLVHNITLMTSCGYFPLVLCVVIIGLFFAVCRLAHMRPVSVMIGSFALMLAPVVIRRTFIGWYDTDPYNLIFLMAVLAIFQWNLQHDRHGMRIGCMAGAVTGLYSAFWMGWPLLFFLTILASVVVAAAMYIRTPDRTKHMFRFAAGYTVMTIAVAILILTPFRFARSFGWGWTFLNKFSSTDVALWPNVFRTVGEATGLSLNELVGLLGHPITVFTGVLGIGLCGYRSWKSDSRNDFYTWMSLSIFFFPLLVLSLRSQRFTLLLSVPLAFFVAWCVNHLLDMIGRSFAGEKRYVLDMTRIAPAVFLVLVIPQVCSAHTFARRVAPIMDDTWFNTLQAIREDTPTDSVVVSWWPPGYFIMALAERRVLLDGGTQHLPEAYWLARALLGESEEEALGYLRMLHVGGNDGTAFLESKGYALSEAVSWIERIAVVSRSEALKELPDDLTEDDKRSLLDMTHGIRRLPATYVLIYNDLVKQNLSLSLMAGWSFDKAEHENDRKRRGIQRSAEPSTLTGSARDIFTMSSQLLKYMPESALTRSEDGILFFDNGLEVNTKSWDAVIQKQDGTLTGQPVSLFYFENDDFRERLFTGQLVDVSALVIERDGTYSSVLANERLIRSMLFRLYYLNGRGLRYFRTFIPAADMNARTRIGVYEIDWPEFERVIVRRSSIQKTG